MKLNLGLRIYKQEFSLSCQPIARVAATASFEDVYFTVNTVRSVEQGNFFAISGAFTNLQASVQHVYSRESTGSFEVDSIVLSFMNSKHVSGVSGVSRHPESQSYEGLYQRQAAPRLPALPRNMDAPGDPSGQLCASRKTQRPRRHRAIWCNATSKSRQPRRFPWTATISISALEINVDLGQALGKSVFAITDFWISSKKTSDWEQNLCLAFERIGVDSTGRMSGFVALQDFKLRTSIQWPEREAALNETPLIQASVGFSQFRDQSRVRLPSLPRSRHHLDGVPDVQRAPDPRAAEIGSWPSLMATQCRSSGQLRQLRRAWRYTKLFFGSFRSAGPISRQRYRRLKDS